MFDAQYTLTESIYPKEDWGHSSHIMGVELAMRAGVNHLCLFHSEPTASDEQLEQIETSTRRYAHLLSPFTTHTHEEMTRFGLRIFFYSKV